MDLRGFYSESLSELILKLFFILLNFVSIVNQVKAET